MTCQSIILKIVRNVLFKSVEFYKHLILMGFLTFHIKLELILVKLMLYPFDIELI